MISRLINLEVPKITKEIPSHISNGNYTIQEYAMAFITGMSDTQRERFKKMLENQLQCGMSVAKSYGIDYDEFIEEVKKQLKVEEK